MNDNQNIIDYGDAVHVRMKTRCVINTDIPVAIVERLLDDGLSIREIDEALPTASSLALIRMALRYRPEAVVAGDRKCFQNSLYDR